MHLNQAVTLDRLLFGLDEIERKPNFDASEYGTLPAIQFPSTVSTQHRNEKDDVSISKVPCVTASPSQRNSAVARNNGYTVGEDKRPAMPNASNQLQQMFWHRPEATWYPTIFNARALVAVGALVVAITCTSLSLTILIIADGQSVSSWRIQPSVYLAVITALANSAIALARMEAIPVSSILILRIIAQY